MPQSLKIFKMKRLILLLSIYFFSYTQLSALSVTASNTNLSCGLNNVTFTFDTNSIDCNFTGSVLINGTGNGIGFPGLNGPPYIETVNGGMISFDIEISSAAAANFNISFIVLSSNLPCAVNNDNASVSFTHGCILPINDNCATAAPLTISTNSCTPQVFTTVNGNTALTVPSCAITDYEDLWYSFIANNTTVTFEYANLPGSFGHYGLYTSCGGTELDCSMIVPGQNIFSFDLTGLTVGDDYLLQVLYNPGFAGMDQTVCLHSTTVQPMCPLNIVVSDAGANMPNQSYDSADVISTNGNCTVTGSGYIYTAEQSIEFNIGFDSGVGDFEAVIGDCIP